MTKYKAFKFAASSWTLMFHKIFAKLKFCEVLLKKYHHLIFCCLKMKISEF